MIEILSAVGPASIQDLGRFGQYRFGVGTSGAMDDIALRAGNILLANDENAAGIEVPMIPFKLRFGHRGANHPVLELDTGRVLVTAQNHGFAVRLPGEGRRFDTRFGHGRVTHVSLYDGTVEGIELTGMPVSSVQYHPEASPGPHDARETLTGFVGSLASAAPRAVA